MGAVAERAYRIGDREAMRGVVRALVDGLGGGSQSEAARVLGVPQPRLNDYLQRRRAGLAPATATRLFVGIHALPRGKRAAVEALWREAVTVPENRHALPRPGREIRFEEASDTPADVAAKERAKRAGRWWSRPNVWREVTETEADAFAATGRAGLVLRAGAGRFDVLEVKGTPGERDEMAWSVLARLNSGSGGVSARFRRLAPATLRYLAE